jgi:FlaA1/EpsC-like NDP-sugar epimerase
MTVEEAVRLTIYAGAIGRSGEVLVLDMGEPVRIADVARRFAEQHDPPLRIQYTGLRPGEKLHEELLATDEHDDRPVHPLITHVPVTPVPLAHAPDVLTAWGLHWPIEPPTPPSTQWSLRP